MEHVELVRYVAKVLEQMQVPYFITGGTASIFYGEPRFTNDVDVVIDLPANRVEEFCACFPENNFYVSVSAAYQAVENKHQFNIIQPESGLKIDVVIAKPTAHDQSRLIRRHQLTIDGQITHFASPEDVIIKKMQYYQEGGSEKHLRDITGILKLCPDPIDRQYIAKWATNLDLMDIWQTILKTT